MEQEVGLELYITPDCNQTCSYCYLCKYKEELYPKELRDEKTILNNLEILLNYCIEKKWNPYRLDLFSGEIWDTNFGYSVLSILENFIEKGLKPRIIVIPSNFSFMLSDEALEHVEKFMEKCRKFSIKPCFSCSNDGLLLDLETRPFNDKNLEKDSLDYYQKLFNFCKKWELGFHPMVSAHGIEKWSENFLWWMSELKRYNFPRNAIMFLEVRNDDWTDEKIYHYLKYLNTCINYYKDEYDSYEENGFVNYIRKKNKNIQYNYSPVFLDRCNLWPGCTIHRTLSVRLGDLAIVPCHRTSYEEFIIGYFNKENEKIVGVTANNIQIMNQIYFNNLSANAKCGTCPYNIICMKGCYGSQFEATGELLYPVESVCNLYKIKFMFIFYKYLKMGILNENDAKDKKFFDLINIMKESKEFEKWYKIVQTLI